jgi:hypothetical protein
MNCPYNKIISFCIGFIRINNLNLKKNKNLIQIIIVSWILLSSNGCMSIYRSDNYSSKENYYTDFNKAVKYCNTVTILNNEKGIFFADITYIKNDSLHLYKTLKRIEKKTLPKSAIKNIPVDQSDKFSPVYVVLASGEDLKVENIQTQTDSVSYTYKYNCIDSGIVFPLDKIKEVRYNNNLAGVPSHLLLGSAVGLVFGSIIDIIAVRPDNGLAFIGGLVLGSVTGGILGWIDGYTNIYLFNP